MGLLFYECRMIYGGIIQRDKSEEKANYQDSVQKSEENLPKLKTTGRIVMVESIQQSTLYFSNSSSVSVVKFLDNLPSPRCGVRFLRYDGATFGGCSWMTRLLKIRQLAW